MSVGNITNSGGKSIKPSICRSKHYLKKSRRLLLFKADGGRVRVARTSLEERGNDLIGQEHHHADRDGPDIVEAQGPEEHPDSLCPQRLSETVGKIPVLLLPQQAVHLQTGLHHVHGRPHRPGRHPRHGPAEHHADPA